jgi:hypothetical protein
MPIRERPVLCRGASRDIVYAVCANGTLPAREFYESLSDADQSKFDALFLRMAEYGEIHTKEKFRPRVGEAVCTVRGKTVRYAVAEFKIHSGGGQRIMACLDGRQWVLTHGFQKGSKLKTEVNRAQRILFEDLSRPDAPSNPRGN